jgi:hypothetical protein
MKRAWWWLRGWRCVYRGYAFVQDDQWDWMMHDLLPDEGREVVHKHGGFDTVKMLVGIAPLYMPGNCVEFHVWAPKGWR